MLTEQEIIHVLHSTGAIKHGHFKLTSGRHSGTYVQCAQLMRSPKTTVELAKAAVSRIPKEIKKAITLVASPAVGGITWGFAVAFVLGVDFIYLERKEGSMQLRRGFSVSEQDRILIAEDVVTTGGSVQEVIDVVKAEGAHVVGVSSIIDRKSGRVFSEPFSPLLELKVESWDPKTCVLCEEGVKIEAPGSRNLQKK